MVRGGLWQRIFVIGVKRVMSVRRASLVIKVIVILDAHDFVLGRYLGVGNRASLFIDNQMLSCAVSGFGCQRLRQLYFNHLLWL